MLIMPHKCCAGSGRRWVLLSCRRFPLTMPHKCHAAPGPRLVPDSYRFTLSLTQGCLVAGRAPPLRGGVRDAGGVGSGRHLLPQSSKFTFSVTWGCIPALAPPLGEGGRRWGGGRATGGEGGTQVGRGEVAGGEGGRGARGDKDNCTSSFNIIVKYSYYSIV